jgi:segregation and condensation protein B
MTDSERPQPPGELDLSGFRAPAAESGLSLERLNQAFAQMLDTRSDPYEPALTPLAQTADEETSRPEDDADTCCETTPRTILEALLFVGNRENRPLAAAEVSGLMRGVRPAEIDDLVTDLNRQYEADRCPYRIASEAAGYRLVLREEFYPLRDKFHGRVREAQLSPSAIEVLALVAYEAAVTNESITKLRGKASGGVLSQLVRRRLLSIGRSDDGATRYRVTPRFLKLFGLERLEDLPRSQDFDTR